MTRDAFEEAKELIKEIDKLQNVIKVMDTQEEIYLAPEKIEIDGGYSHALRSDYKFSGELKDRIVKTIKYYIEYLEGLLSDL